MGIFSFVTDPIRSIGEKIVEPIKVIGDKATEIVNEIGHKTGINHIIKPLMVPVQMAFDLKKKFENLPYVNQMIEITKQLPVVGGIPKGLDRIESIVNHLEKGEFGQVAEILAKYKLEALKDALPMKYKLALKALEEAGMRADKILSQRKNRTLEKQERLPITTGMGINEKMPDFPQAVKMAKF